MSLTVEPGNVLRCQWGLAPAVPLDAWLVGIPTRSEIGETTELGF